MLLTFGTGEERVPLTFSMAILMFAAALEASIWEGVDCMGRSGVVDESRSITVAVVF